MPYSVQEMMKYKFHNDEGSSIYFSKSRACFDSGWFGGNCKSLKASRCKYV